jgi:hypothetical protein
MLRNNKRIFMLENEEKRFKYLVDFMYDEIKNHFFDFEIIQNYKSNTFSLINWNQLIENINKSK